MTKLNEVSINKVGNCINICFNEEELLAGELIYQRQEQVNENSVTHFTIKPAYSIPDYKALLVSLLSNGFSIDESRELNWAWIDGISVKDIDEELNDKLYEIMREWQEDE